MNLKKNQASEVIHDLVLDNDTQNTDAIILNNDSKMTTKNEHNMNKSKLSKLTSNPSGFIKQVFFIFLVNAYSVYIYKYNFFFLGDS